MMAELYTDRVHITRAAVPGDVEYVDNTTIDESTGQYPVQGRVTIYRGPARLQVKADINSNVVETTAAEREWTYLTAQLQLPVTLDEALAIDGTTLGDPAAVATDNVVAYELCPYDTSMVGREFNVAGPYHKSHAVYRRFRVREVVA